MASLQDIIQVPLIGCGATLVMDIWLLFLKRISIPTLNFAFIGRWVGHCLRGRLAHTSIAQAPQIPHELLLGWLTHYATGIAFAVLLVGFCGFSWVATPTLAPALLVGVSTVAFPWLLMQPAMGLGVAASKTPAPLRNCARSLGNHAVFGLGLFLSASLIGWLTR